MHIWDDVQIYTYYTYIILYHDIASGVLTTVGLAQARPNYMRCIFYNFLLSNLHIYQKIMLEYVLSCDPR